MSDPRLANIRSRTSAAGLAVSQRSWEITSAQDRVSRLQGEIAALTDSSGVLERAQMVLSSIGETEQDRVRIVVESLVTRGLQAVFDPSLSFHLETTVSGKTVSTGFLVRSTFPDGTSVTTPVVEARGGGLAATVGFLLRLVMLLLSPESERRLLVLDETFAFVSKEYVGRVAEFLKEICQQTGLQIVLVTHQDEFLDSGGACYRFSLGADGVTYVSKA